MVEKTQDIGAILREVLPGAVMAAVTAMREADAKAEQEAEMARISARQKAAEVEAGRPPRVRNIKAEDLTEAAAELRAGSSIKVRVHRRIRAKAWRDGESTSEPAVVKSLHPDEVVTMPVEPEAIAEGQTPREVAYHMLRGMFEIAA